MTASSFITSADNASIQYMSFNAKTGKLIETYTLYSMPTSDNSRGVIPPDTRYKDWSKSGVVKLMSSSNYIGTGFVVGEHVIATAAHCLKDYTINDILLFKSNSSTVTMHATPVEMHYPTIYDYYANANNINEKRKYDYGLITVKEDLSDYMCFDLASPVGSIKDKVVKVTGFPEEYNTYTTHIMYTGQGKILSNPSTSDKMLIYDVDTSGGNSGGPIYITESYNGQQYYSVIGVHTGIYESNVSNRGTRMTFDLIHFYSNNGKINY